MNITSEEVGNNISDNQKITLAELFACSESDDYSSDESQEETPMEFDSINI